MCNPLLIIGAVFTLSFAILTVVGGAFSLYFGAGKTRRIGVGLFGLGIAVIAIYALALMLDWEWFPFEDVNIYEAALVVLGVILGAIVAAGMFLFAIIKS